MTPKDNAKLTLLVYSDWLEENNQLEKAEAVREELTYEVECWTYSYRRQRLVQTIPEIYGVGTGSLHYNEVGTMSYPGAGNSIEIGSYNLIFGAEVGQE